MAEKLQEKVMEGKMCTHKNFKYRGKRYRWEMTGWQAAVIVLGGIAVVVGLAWFGIAAVYACVSEGMLA